MNYLGLGWLIPLRKLQKRGGGQRVRRLWLEGMESGRDRSHRCVDLEAYPLKKKKHKHLNVGLKPATPEPLNCRDHYLIIKLFVVLASRCIVVQDWDNRLSVSNLKQNLLEIPSYSHCVNEWLLAVRFDARRYYGVDSKAVTKPMFCMCFCLLVLVTVSDEPKCENNVKPDKHLLTRYV